VASAVASRLGGRTGRKHRPIVRKPEQWLPLLGRPLRERRRSGRLRGLARPTVTQDFGCRPCCFRRRLPL